MPKSHNYINDKNELSKEASRILASHESDYEYLYKISLVKRVLDGVDAKTLSEESSFSARTLQRYVQKADEKGFDSLRTKNRTGRPPILTSFQKEEIKCLLEDPNSAYECGYSLWDSCSLSDYISNNYCVNVSMRYCQNLFHEFDFSLKVPQMYPNYQKNQGARENFKIQLAEILKDPYSIIVCQDEVHFYQQTTVTRMWCPKGFIPTVASAPGKASIAYSGFVILGKGNGQLFIDKPDWFTFETTIQSIISFMEKYPVYLHNKFYLIMDNAPWHRKAKRIIMEDPQYAFIKDNVIFLDIPPYSPDLNPIEQVWRYTRKQCTHNVYYPKLYLLENTLDRFWSRFSVSNEELSRLCTFNFKEKSNQREKYQVGMYVHDKWVEELHTMHYMVSSNFYDTLWSLK